MMPTPTVRYCTRCGEKRAAGIGWCACGNPEFSLYANPQYYAWLRRMGKPCPELPGQRRLF